jgi:hypothetical protein
LSVHHPALARRGTQTKEFAVLFKPNTASLNIPQALQTRRRPTTPPLAPNLLAALSELAVAENLSLAALITMLINEALSRRQARRRRL